MDSDVFQKHSNIVRHREYQWFLVQYYKDPTTFIRKVVRSDEMIWSPFLQILTNSSQYMEHALIRDDEQIFLGYILHKSVDKRDALDQSKFLEFICTKLLYSSHELYEYAIAERFYFNIDSWLLVMYSTKTITIHGIQTVFTVFHSKEVILKRDNQSNNIVAFIREQQSTHKCTVIQISYDISDLMVTMDIIKNDVTKVIKEMKNINNEEKNKKFDYKIDEMEQRVCKEYKMLTEAVQTVHERKTKLVQKLNYLRYVIKLSNLNNN